MNSPFHPFPILPTERLILRNYLPQDKMPFFTLRSNEAVMKYIPRTRAIVPDDVDSIILSTQDLLGKEEAINWFIEHKETGETIGSIGFYRMQKEDFRTEVGYMLSPHYQKKGIMNEALQCVLAYGFGAMNFNSIFAVIDAQNVASQNLVLKNNFKLEGAFKEDCFFEGRFLDSNYYSLLKRNFSQEQKSL